VVDEEGSSGSIRRIHARRSFAGPGPQWLGTRYHVRARYGAKGEIEGNPTMSTPCCDLDLMCSAQARHAPTMTSWARSEVVLDGVAVWVAGVGSEVSPHARRVSVVGDFQFLATGGARHAVARGTDSGKSS